MARTTILLEDDLLLAVKQLASLKGTTATEIIRKALRAYIKRQRQAKLPSFTGIGSSGQSSVSQRAEEILQAEAEKKEGW